MTELRPWSGFDSLVDGLARLQARAREAAARSVDEILTVRNWLIGAWIVAYEQEGADRARYGEGLMDALAASFKARGVGGLGRSNLKNYRQIALTWPTLGTRQTLSGESVTALATSGQVLPWQDDAWMLRLRQELSFSQLLELSRDREAVLALADEGRLLDSVTANVRDPYVLEFLGLPERQVYSEADLESALLDHLQEFLLELGGDFVFLGRQYRITVGGRHHFIDLLFFHRRLRCLVAIDLKIGAFGHEDAGQMNFYLNYLRENISLADESLPVGIVLCADKDAEEVHYAKGNLEQQVFV